MLMTAPVISVGKFFGRKEFSDVVLEVEKQHFPCHKVVLALQSAKFESLLRNENAQVINQVYFNS